MKIYFWYFKYDYIIFNPLDDWELTKIVLEMEIMKEFRKVKG
jgi:hypothetical protein